MFLLTRSSQKKNGLNSKQVSCFCTAYFSLFKILSCDTPQSLDLIIFLHRLFSWNFRDFLILSFPFPCLVLHQDTPQSLSYGLNMHRSCRRAPDRVFSDEFHQRRAPWPCWVVSQPPIGSQSLFIRGLVLQPGYYPISSGCLFQCLEIWRFCGLLWITFSDVAL